MECSCNPRNVQDLLADRKTPHEWRFGESYSKEQSFRLEQWSNIIRFQPEIKQEFSNLVREGLTKYLSGICLDRGRNLGRRYSDCWHWRIGKFGCIGNLSPEIECKRSLDNSVKRRICTSCGRWYSKIVRKRLRIPGTHFKTEQTVRRESVSGDSQGEAEESQPTELKDDSEARREFWSTQVDFVYRHHIEPRFQFVVSKEETFPIPLKHIDVMRSTCTDLDVVQEKRVDDYCKVDEDRGLWDSWTGFTKGDRQKFKQPLDQIIFGQKLGQELGKLLRKKNWTESSIKCAERRNISCSSEIYWCCEVYKYRTGRGTRKMYWRLLECWWRLKIVRFVDRIHEIYYVERDTSLHKEKCGPVRDWQKFKQLLDQIIFGQKRGPGLRKPLKRKTRMGNWETETQKCQEFVISIRMTKNTKTSLKTREKWKHQWLMLCQAKDPWAHR